MTVCVLWLFLSVLCVGLQCVIVVFPNHTNLPFCRVIMRFFCCQLYISYIQAMEADQSLCAYRDSLEPLMLAQAKNAV